MVGLSMAFGTGRLTTTTLRVGLPFSLWLLTGFAWDGGVGAGGVYAPCSA